MTKKYFFKKDIGSGRISYEKHIFWDPAVVPEKQADVDTYLYDMITTKGYTASSEEEYNLNVPKEV